MNVDNVRSHMKTNGRQGLHACDAMTPDAQALMPSFPSWTNNVEFLTKLDNEQVQARRFGLDKAEVRSFVSPRCRLL